jgi:hypothetical protein
MLPWGWLRREGPFQGEAYESEIQEAQLIRPSEEQIRPNGALSPSIKGV